jgi:nitroreductase
MTSEGRGRAPAPPLDVYQERYLAHQARKRDVLIEIMRQRHSDRMFSDEKPSADSLAAILGTKELCPSSCDRQAISVRIVESRDELALLGGVLVGGVGWVHRAPVVLLLFADPAAYKAGDEIEYMPYLDAGVVVQQFWLAATAEGLASAYVNPNVRPMNREHFHQVFGDGIFCGAFALGYPL